MKKIEERGKIHEENGYKNMLKQKKKIGIVIVDEGACLLRQRLRRQCYKIREECSNSWVI